MARETSVELRACKERIRSLESELYMAWQAYLDTIPDKYRELLVIPKGAGSRDIYRWRHKIAARLLAMTQPDSFGRSLCPLCGKSPQTPYQKGFSYPTGLERHFLGAHGAWECRVVKAVRDQARLMSDQNADDEDALAGWEEFYKDVARGKTDRRDGPE